MVVLEEAWAAWAAYVLRPSPILERSSRETWDSACAISFNHRRASPWRISGQWLYGLSAQRFQQLLVRLDGADYCAAGIRGLALSAQGGPALGPFLAGFFFDATNCFQVPFLVFAAYVWSVGLLVQVAIPPQMPSAAPPADTKP